MIEIIVDDRERAVVSSLFDCQESATSAGGRCGRRQAEFANVTLTIKRIEVGDYCVVINGVVRAIIERKSIQDLAASISDGRINNIEKLRVARAATKCAVVYLIEGTMPRKGFVGAIPVHALQSHLDHLGIRDGVYITYSRDLDDTAQRLFDLAVNISTLPFETPDVAHDVDATLHPTKIPPSVRDKSIGVLMSLDMGRMTADAFVDAFERGEAGGCLGDFLRRDWTADSLMDCGVKYRNGAGIRRTLANKICSAMTMIRLENSPRVIKIPGMGKVAVETMCTRTTLSELLGDFDPKALAARKVLSLKMLTAIKELLAPRPTPTENEPSENEPSEETPMPEPTPPTEDKSPEPKSEETKSEETNSAVEEKKVRHVRNKRKPKPKPKPTVCEFDTSDSENEK